MTTPKQQKPREWVLSDARVVTEINGITVEHRIAFTKIKDAPITGNCIPVREVLPDDPAPDQKESKSILAKNDSDMDQPEFPWSEFEDFLDSISSREPTSHWTDEDLLEIARWAWARAHGRGG